MDCDIRVKTNEERSWQTWLAPIRVNDDSIGNGANQFQSQMAVAPDGVVSIYSFFDTRNDSRHLLIDVYLAQSVDHGTSFLRIVPRYNTELGPGC